MSALVGKTPISLCERERLAEISLVCCDMDGTWLSPAHGPTDGGMKALAEAEKAAVKVPLQAYCLPRCGGRDGATANALALALPRRRTLLRPWSS